MLKFGSKKDLNADYKCTIRLLDDNEVLEGEFQSYQKGKYLLDFVFKHLNVIETDYFGLRYVDQHKQRHWLDPNKNILRQIKSLMPILFCFRTKFYPADPLKLQEEITRYQLFLQLRRDLLHGRLYCTQADAAQLAAIIVQADLGNYNPDEQFGSYVSEYKLLLKQTPKIEEKIMELHQSLKGLDPSNAELQFLKKASSLDTYGVDPHPVKDHRGTQLYLGLNHSGVLTFQGSRKTHHFKWVDIQKLNYEGKMFIIHISIYEKENRTKKKHTVGFKCPTATSCRHLWRCAVEQRLFYTLYESNKHGVVVTGGSFFSRGSRFRYLGRCEREVVQESAVIGREPPLVKRAPLRNIGRSTSLPATPAESDTYDAVMSRVHRPLPYIDRSSSLDEEVLCAADTPIESPMPDGLNQLNGPGAAYCPESTLPPLNLLEPLLEAQETKSRSSSILDSSFLDAEGSFENFEAPLSGDQLHSSIIDDSSTVTTSNINGGEEAMLQQQLFCDYNTRGHTSEFGDTSSTETLGPIVYQNDADKLNSFSAHSLDKRMKNSNSRRTPNRDVKIRRHSPMPVDSSQIHHPMMTRQVSLRTASVKTKVIAFFRIFMIAFIIVILMLLIFVVFMFESNTDLMEGIRSSQEIVLLRIQYYEPIKRFIKRRFLSDGE